MKKKHIYTIKQYNEKVLYVNQISMSTVSYVGHDSVLIKMIYNLVITNLLVKVGFAMLVVTILRICLSGLLLNNAKPPRVTPWW